MVIHSKRILIVFVFYLAILSRLPLNAQQNPTGKTYIALTQEDCAKTLGGGYTIYTYCVLKFDKDSVCVTVYSTTSNDLVEKRIHTEHAHTWEIKDKRVLIHGFDNYGLLEMQQATLIGKKVGNNEEVVFH